LRQVELTAVGITEGDLSRRIPDPDPRTEVGEVGAALNTMLDELHTSSVQRQAALSAAQDSEARMRQFVADASHELRTPLTSVHGISELYRQGAIPSDQIADAFAGIEEQSERMAQLVNDLLLLARRDERLPLDRRPVDLLEVCSDAVRTTTTQRSVSLEMIPGSRAPIVDGDATGLRQVVDNLMVNAVQHGQGDIVVAVGTEGEEAVVRVSDEGPGVAASDRLRVFDRFYRGADDRSRSTGGSGLGLSIVAAIVAAHGGTVNVQGSVFTVRLPCRPVP
jgi:two-component system OmpR family sensor kinase